MENDHFQWVNPLFLWSCSIAMLNYQRVYPHDIRMFHSHAPKIAANFAKAGRSNVFRINFINLPRWFQEKSSHPQNNGFMMQIVYIYILYGNRIMIYTYILIYIYICMGRVCVYIYMLFNVGYITLCVYMCGIYAYINILNIYVWDMYMIYIYIYTVYVWAIYMGCTIYVCMYVNVMLCYRMLCNVM